MKTTMLFILMAVLCAAFSTVNAQGWTPLDSTSNVSIFYRQSPCSGDTCLFLKVVNANADSTTVTWTLWQGGATHVLLLQANQELYGDCTESSPAELWEYFPPGLTVADLAPVISTQ